MRHELKRQSCSCLGFLLLLIQAYKRKKKIQRDKLFREKREATSIKDKLYQPVLTVITFWFMIYFDISCLYHDYNPLLSHPLAHLNLILGTKQLLRNRCEIYIYIERFGIAFWYMNNEYICRRGFFFGTLW